MMSTELVVVSAASASTSASPAASALVGFLPGSIARYAFAATAACGAVEIGRRCKRRMQQTHQDASTSAQKKRRVGKASANVETTGDCSEEKVRQLKEEVEHLTSVVSQQDEKLRKMPNWNDIGPIVAQVRELQAKMDQKPNHAEVPSLQQVLELGVKVDKKPNRDEVPTLDQLADLSLEIERKPGFEQVVKTGEAVHPEQFLAALNEKPNFDQVASLAQMRQLQKSIADIENQELAAHLAELSTAINRKPDVEQVPTIAEVQKLTTDMKERVVPGLMQVQELMSVLGTKENPHVTQVTKIEIKEDPHFTQVAPIEILDESSEPHSIQAIDDDLVQTFPLQVTEPIIA
jgi:Skp family chaperone for outer membrane proteins